MLYLLISAAAAASFSCADESALTDVEKAICWSEALSSRDDALAGWYQRRLSELPDAERALLQEAQRSWLAERDSACSGPQGPDHACLGERYDARILTLASQAGATLPGREASAASWRSEIGVLTIYAGAGGGFDLEIETVVGPTAHICAFRAAEIPWTDPTALTATGEEGCEIQISFAGDSARIFSNEGCRYYCGARAYIDGTYALAP